MIPYNNITKHDFVPVDVCKTMQEAGVPTDDAYYFITKYRFYNHYEIHTKEEVSKLVLQPDEIYPTYTLSQLLYKLDEWHPDYKGLTFYKDAPFYFFLYEDAKDESEFSLVADSPIVAAAYLLINCVKEGFGCVKNINSKYES
jgi:hypothetical protein